MWQGWRLLDEEPGVGWGGAGFCSALEQTCNLEEDLSFLLSEGGGALGTECEGVQL